MADWHPRVKDWWESLAESGQATYYEPSDWATAAIVAESMSRDLKPRVVGVNLEGVPVKAKVPMSGASLSAYLRAMTALMVTEGDRRRAGLEIERAGRTDTEEAASVEWLDAARARRGRTG